MADEPILVQKAATKEDLIKDHIAGLGGYEIAEKYGLDTEKVKQILADANNEGSFIPNGKTGDADSPVERPDALVEGVNPKPEVADTKASTKNNP